MGKYACLAAVGIILAREEDTTKTIFLEGILARTTFSLSFASTSIERSEVRHFSFLLVWCGSADIFHEAERSCSIDFPETNNSTNRDRFRYEWLLKQITILHEWIGRRRRYKCYYPISFFLQKVQFCSCVVLSVLTLRRVAWQFDTIKQLLRFRACRSGELASSSLVVRVRLFANWKLRAIAILFRFSLIQ